MSRGLVFGVVSSKRDGMWVIGDGNDIIRSSFIAALRQVVIGGAGNAPCKVEKFKLDRRHGGTETAASPHDSGIRVWLSPHPRQMRLCCSLQLAASFTCMKD
jgi:hypothetical protein